MVMCWAKNCKHYNQRETCKFFRFSYANLKERKRWQNLVGREDEPGPGAYLCSCHFPDGNRESGPVLCLLDTSNSLKVGTIKPRNLNCFSRAFDINDKTKMMMNPDVIIPDIIPPQPPVEEVLVDRNDMVMTASTPAPKKRKWVTSTKTLLCMSHFDPGTFARKNPQPDDIDLSQLEGKEDHVLAEDPQPSQLYAGPSHSQELESSQIWLEERNQDNFISEIDEGPLSDEEALENTNPFLIDPLPTSLISEKPNETKNSTSEPSHPRIKQEPMDEEKYIPPVFPPPTHPVDSEMHEANYYPSLQHIKSERRENMASQPINAPPEENKPAVPEGIGMEDRIIGFNNLSDTDTASEDGNYSYLENIKPEPNNVPLLENIPGNDSTVSSQKLTVTKLTDKPPRARKKRRLSWLGKQRKRKSIAKSKRTQPSEKLHRSSNEEPTSESGTGSALESPSALSEHKNTDEPKFESKTGDGLESSPEPGTSNKPKSKGEMKRPSIKLVSSISEDKPNTSDEIKKIKIKEESTSKDESKSSGTVKRMKIKKEPYTSEDESKSSGIAGGEGVIVNKEEILVKQEKMFITTNMETIENPEVTGNTDEPTIEEANFNVSLASLFGDEGYEPVAGKHGRVLRSLTKEKNRVPLPPPPARGILKPPTSKKGKKRPRKKSVRFFIPPKEESSEDGSDPDDDPDPSVEPATSQNQVPEEIPTASTSTKLNANSPKRKKRKKMYYGSKKGRRRSITPPEAKPTVSKNNANNSNSSSKKSNQPTVSCNLNAKKNSLKKTKEKEIKKEAAADQENAIVNELLIDRHHNHNYGRIPKEVIPRKPPPKWSMEDLEEACLAIKNQVMGTYKAARVFGVPISSIRNSLSKEIEELESTKSEPENEAKPTPSGSFIKVKPLETLLADSSIAQNKDAGVLNQRKQIKTLPPVQRAVSPERRVSKVMKPVYQCNKCNFLTIAIEDMQAHLLMKHSNEKTCCPHCNIIMDSMLDVMAHFEENHPSLEEFNKVFNSSPNPELRARLEYKPNYIKCVNCHFHAAHYSVLLRHQKLMHYNSTGYLCMYCKKPSEKIVDLLIHICAYHGVGFDHHCSYCAHAYSAIPLHVPEYTNTDIKSRPYCCQACTFSCMNCEQFLRHAIENHPV